METRKHVYKIDIDEGLKYYPLGSLLAAGDKLADTVQVELTKGGNVYALSGCTVTGYMIRPDDVTIKIPGSGAGNIASVTFLQECYAYEGAFRLAVTIADGDMTQTAAVFNGRIVRTQTDNIIVDPGTVVPNLDDLLAQIAKMEAATKAANEAADNANTAADKMPIVGDNGTWLVWDYDTGAYVDSLSPSTGAQGPQGVSVNNAVINTDGYLIIALSNGNSINAGKVNASEGAGADGVGIQEIRKTNSNGLVDTYTITYTNGGSFDFQITNGKDGEKGDSGVSCTHSWEGTVLTVTSASGTTSADLKGEKGDTGATGGNGYTPVKGIDYYTDAEKAEFVEEVKNAADAVVWHDLQVNADNATYPTDGTGCVYTKVNQIVSLQGGIRTKTTIAKDQTINVATMPEGFRPKRSISDARMLGGSIFRLTIGTDGVVSVTNFNSTALSNNYNLPLNIEYVAGN